MTATELKILQDAADDRTYEETARDLQTSEQRIKNLAFRILKKLQVRSKAGAVSVALRRQLID
jgi:DNA-binding CsgD family transcriptional regulator